MGRLGVNKLFIRNPKTLFETEAKFLAMQHTLASKIRAKFLAYSGKKKYQQMRAAGTSRVRMA